jgi:hypothetical protein
MKRSVVLHPFFSISNLWPVFMEVREGASPITPKPPKPEGEPDEPEREFPFWTYFIDNPRRENLK